jgi:hypothetical protein
MVSGEEFNKMIDMATSAQKRSGILKNIKLIFLTQENRFKKMILGISYNLMLDLIIKEVRTSGNCFTVE